MGWIKRWSGLIPGLALGVVYCLWPSMTSPLWAAQTGSLAFTDAEGNPVTVYQTPTPQIYVELTDFDLRQAGTVTVQLQSDTEPEPESLTLTETGDSTGVFRAAMRLDYVSGRAAADGDLDVVIRYNRSETLTATYQDLENLAGAEQEITLQIQLEKAPGETTLEAGEITGLLPVLHSPYIVPGGLTVPQGQTLTVEPGVEVHFTGHSRLTVHGELTAQGTEEEPIIWTTTRKNPIPGAWDGIYFESGSRGIIEHNQLLYANYGIYINATAAVVPRQNLIRDSKYSAFYCRGEGVDVTIIGNHIQRSRAYGIYVTEGASPTIEGNTIEGAADHGIYLRQSPTPLIQNNIIVNNNQSGIAVFTGSNLTLTGTILMGNSNGVLLNNASGRIENCTIVDNALTGITAFRAGAVEIHTSSIHHNRQYDIKNSSSTDINARRNWWGRETMVQMSQARPGTNLPMLNDRADQAANGIIDYADWLPAPPADAPDQPLTITSVGLKGDDQYRTNQPTYIRVGDTLYIEMHALDRNPYSRDEAPVRITSSTTDPTGIMIALRESAPNSGMYRGTSRIATASDPLQNVIGGAVGERITVTARADSSKSVSFVIASFPPVASNLRVEAPERHHVVRQAPRIQWTYQDPEGDLQEAYEIQVGTDDDWTEAEMWTSGPLTGTDSVAVYGGQPLLDGQTYYMRVRTQSTEFWSEWTGYSFRMNTAPPVPVARIPKMLGIVNSTTPTLSVSRMQDTEQDELLFLFQVAADSLFTTILDSASGVPQGRRFTAWTMRVALQENQGYWWRARAWDGYEWGEWMAATPFFVNVIDEPTPPFSLRHPGPDSVVTTLYPTFEWEATVDPDPGDSITYTLWYSTLPSFAQKTEVTGLRENHYSPPRRQPLQDNTVYYWRVRASVPHLARIWATEQDWSFFVNQANDRPRISSIPPITILEDVGREDALDLNNYVTDPDHDIATLQWFVRSSAHIEATLTERNTVNLQPKPNWNGREKIRVGVLDPAGGGDSTEVEVEVFLVNDPPVLSGLPADTTILEDTSLTLDMSRYTTDIDNPLDQLIWTFRGNQSLKVDFDTRRFLLTITPPHDWFGGPENIQITVTDAPGGRASHTIAVTVLPEVEPPVITTPSSWSFDEDTQLVIPLDPLIRDPDQLPPEVKWTTSGYSHIIPALDEQTRVLTLRAEPDWFGGPEVLTFIAVDPDGGADTAQVAVTVRPVNDAPVVTDIPDSIFAEDTSIQIALDDYVSDVDNNRSELQWTTLGQNQIAVQIDPTTHVATLTPALNWYGGPEQITFKVIDPGGLSAEDPAAFTVTSVIEPPVITAIPPLTFDEDTAFELSLDRYVNDPDHRSEQLKWTYQGQQQIQVALDERTRQVRFSAPRNWHGGPELITFTVEDPDQTRDSITVSVTVASVNDLPVVTDIPEIRFDEDTQVTLDLTQYVTDEDHPNSALRWTFSGNQQIQVALDTTTQVATLSAPHNWYGGPELITFTVTDPEGGSASTTTPVTVISVVEPPVIAGIPDQNFDEDTAVTLNLDDYVTDPDHSQAQLTWDISGSTHIISTIGATHKVVLRPQTNWYGGPETLLFRATDPDGASAEATVLVTVRSVVEPPVLADIPEIRFNEDQSITLELDPYVSDPDHQPSELTWAITGQQNIQVHIYPPIPEARTVQFSAPENWFGSETLTFTVTDPDQAKDSKPVTVRVMPVNDPPVMTDIPPITFAEDNTFQIPLNDYVSDLDDPKETLTWHVSGTTNMAISIAPVTAVATLTPAPNWYGQETLTFTVTDQPGGQDSRTVQVTVTSVVEAPVVTTIPAQTFAEDGSLKLDLNAYGSDPDHDKSLLTWQASGYQEINVAIDPDTHIARFSAPQDWYGGPEQITFTATDPDGATGQATVAVTVEAVNDPPQVNLPATIRFNEDRSYQLALNEVGRDVDHKPAELKWVASGGQQIKVDINSAGKVATFSAPQDWYGGPEQITFTATDPDGATGQATVAVTVEAVNDPPLLSSFTPRNDPHLKETEQVTFQVQVSDVDGDPLTYSWRINGTEQPNAKQATYTLVTDYDAPRRMEVEVTVTDGTELVEKTWTVTIDNVNRPPEVPQRVGPSAGSTLTEEGQLSWSGAQDPDGDPVTYMVVISEASNFTSAVISIEEVNTTSVVLQALDGFARLKPGTTYYWRVRARDNQGGTSDFTEGRSFVFQPQSP